jgi:hypothetical protein
LSSFVLEEQRMIQTAMVITNRFYKKKVELMRIFTPYAAL